MSRPSLPAPRPGCAAHLELRQATPVVVVDISEWLDLETAPQVRAVVDAGLARADERLDVDLSSCEGADLQGIDMLEKAQRRAALQGTELVLTGVNPRLRRVLHLLGVDAVVAVEPQLTEAAS